MILIACRLPQLNLYPNLSNLILFYFVLSHLIVSRHILYHCILCYLIVSYRILSHVILSYLILSCHVISYPVLPSLVLFYCIFQFHSISLYSIRFHCILFNFIVLCSILIFPYLILSYLILSLLILSCHTISFILSDYISSYLMPLPPLLPHHFTFVHKLSYPLSSSILYSPIHLLCSPIAANMPPPPSELKKLALSICKRDWNTLTR